MTTTMAVTCLVLNPRSSGSAPPDLDPFVLLIPSITWSSLPLQNLPRHLAITSASLRGRTSPQVHLHDPVPGHARSTQRGLHGRAGLASEHAHACLVCWA